MGVKVTEKQLGVLITLSLYESEPTARQLADKLDQGSRAGSTVYTVGSVYRQLRRLQAKALVGRRRVERGGIPVWAWFVSAPGTHYLESLNT